MAVTIDGTTGVTIPTGVFGDASGNVGIGTISPSAPGGTVNCVVYSTGTTIIKSQTSSTTTGVARYDYATGTANSYVISSLNDNSGAPFYNLSSGSGVTTSYTDFTTQVWRNTGGATEYMRINSSGNVGIGTSSPSASAILDAQSTTKGVRMPNMTTTQKNAISTPAAGLMVFDTTLSKLCVYTGSAWQTITSA